MKDLQITNKITPAKVEFNYQEIEEQLEIVLKKYKGLVFTDETVKDCKKTIAELRKGQKSLDDFRKETKKALTQSVTEFENDCKVLYNKFTEVIDPLKEQADYFEEQRKIEKKQAVERVLADVKATYELNEKYGNKLIIEDEYLNASKSIAKVKENLSVIANDLRTSQRQEESNINLITETVQKSNKDNEITLIIDSYTRLAEYEDIGKIIAKIYEDTNKLVQAKEAEKLKLEKIEAERLAKEEQERILLESVVEYEEEEISKETPEELNIHEFDTLPTEAAKITKTYKVTGNAQQIKDMEIFLEAIFNEWECI